MGIETLAAQPADVGAVVQAMAGSEGLTARLRVTTLDYRSLQ
jgi:hypothetical protein